MINKKAIFVDPFNGVVEPIVLQKFEDLYELFDTDVVQMVRSYWQGESMKEFVLCDENASFKNYNGYQRGVGHKLMNLETARPILGKFVIMGYDEQADNLIDTELTPHEVGPLMIFYAWEVKNNTNGKA